MMMIMMMVSADIGKFNLCLPGASPGVVSRRKMVTETDVKKPRLTLRQRAETYSTLVKQLVQGLAQHLVHLGEGFMRHHPVQERTVYNIPNMYATITLYSLLTTLHSQAHTSPLKACSYQQQINYQQYINCYHTSLTAAQFHLSEMVLACFQTHSSFLEDELHNQKFCAITRCYRFTTCFD